MSPGNAAPSDRLTHASTVLIVDDHEGKRELLSCILKRNNFAVIEATDGRMGLTMIDRLRPDVVLLDVLMPEMDGFEVCRRMKAVPETAEIPVLFVTVLDKDESSVEGLQLGGDDFINWPVNASELVARINARIRSHQPLTQLRNVIEEQTRLLQEERQREASTEFELQQARLVQQRFISGDLPEGRGLTFASYYRPSRQVGGDLFDVVHLNGSEVAILMADISGHGMPAALLTTVTKVLFRTGIEQCQQPAALLRWLNRQMRPYLAIGEFLTVYLGVWNSASKIFSFAGAGHPPALLITPQGDQVQQLHVSPGLVGIMSDQDFPRASIPLRPGQRVAFYTDGILEATNLKQELFGERRLADVCARTIDLPLKPMVDELFGEIDHFLDGAPQSDDQAFLIMEVTE